MASKLASLWMKRFAMNKLTQEKPSTAPVGNERLCLAVNLMAERFNVKVRRPRRVRLVPRAQPKVCVCVRV